MVQATLYLLHYNDYYNRLIKREDTISDYIKLDAGLENGEPKTVLGNIDKVNFIPNDYIHAQQIINWDGENPDYVIVVDEDGNINSRWFVISNKRIRAEQLQLELRRDVVADFRDEVLASTGYVRRALLPASNPLIYNSENMNFNQIKVNEVPLYDKTKTPWIVGYTDLQFVPNEDINIDFEAATVPLTNYQEIVDMSKKKINVIDGNILLDITTYYYKGAADHWFHHYEVNPGGSTTVNTVHDSNYVNWGRNESWRFAQPNNNTGTNCEGLSKSFNSQQQIIDWIDEYSSNVEKTNIYQQYNNRVVKSDSSDDYYQITVKSVGNTKVDVKVAGSLLNLTDPLVRANTNIGYYSASTSNRVTDTPNSISNIDGYKYIVPCQIYELSLEKISYGNYTIKFATGKEPKKLNDAPYKMFCMPYNEKNYLAAIDIHTKYGSHIYDIQLLPYCPVPTQYNSSGQPIVMGTVGVDYNLIDDKSGGAQSYLFWAENSVFTFNINTSITLDSDEYTINTGDIKIDNECDMYRLCSPNGNGTFEFSVTKNGGLKSINVDCTYRPYDPYIHMNPDFGNLYGRDWNDFRGLILNGDFSIPALNDAWTQYTINNKNYQNIFNREIQSLTFQNKIAEKQDIFNAFIGTITGGVAGGMGGSIFGGGGVGVGAGIGALASGIAGGYDVYYNKQLRQEQMNLKKDLFKYNLQNIQAIPQSVSKTGCLTNNNKKVPYIEYYTCTETEKNILRQKIKWTGMTVGAMGVLNDYVSIGGGEDGAQYIEADIIKIDMNEDYHITMEIARELSDGVRFA